MKQTTLYTRISMSEMPEIVLEYYLITESVSPASKSYGVKIRKLHNCSESGQLSETQQINGIFSEKHDAESFLKYIAKHEVTPISFRDVTEDYII